MSKHILSKNYKNISTISECEGRTLLAVVESWEFVKKLSFEDKERRHSNVILLHTKIEYPKIFRSYSLNIEIIPYVEPTIICHSDEERYGVGILRPETALKDFDLFVAYEPEEFRELHEFLFSCTVNHVSPLKVFLDVLGLNEGCEWDMESGGLLVTGVSFQAWSHEHPMTDM